MSSCHHKNSIRFLRIWDKELWEMARGDSVSPSKRLGILNRAIAFEVDYRCYRAYQEFKNSIERQTMKNLDLQQEEVLRFINQTRKK